MLVKYDNRRVHNTDMFLRLPPQQMALVTPTLLIVLPKPRDCTLQVRLYTVDATGVEVGRVSVGNFPFHSLQGCMDIM